MKLFHMMELIGMSLLLMVFCWELYIDRNHEKMISKMQFEHIAKRLDDIHSRQNGLQNDINNVAQQISTNTVIGANYVSKEKYHKSYAKVGKRLGNNAKRWRRVRTIIFIIGSVLLIIGKYLEFNVLKKGKKQPNTEETKKSGRFAEHPE